MPNGVTLSCQLEGGLRPGRVFEEHVDLGEPRQDLGMLHILPVQIDILVCKIKEISNFIGAKMLNPKQVFCAECHRTLMKRSKAYRKGGALGQAAIALGPCAA